MVFDHLCKKQTHILKSKWQPLITAFTALGHPMPTLINVSDSLIPKRQETIRILKKRSLGIEAMAKLNSVRTQAQPLACNHPLCLFSSPWVAVQWPRRQLKPVTVPKTQQRAGHPQSGEKSLDTWTRAILHHLSSGLGNWPILFMS